jgi:hypothetical protein
MFAIMKAGPRKNADDIAACFTGLYNDLDAILSCKCKMSLILGLWPSVHHANLTPPGPMLEIICPISHKLLAPTPSPSTRPFQPYMAAHVNQSFNYEGDNSKPEALSVHYSSFGLLNKKHYISGTIGSLSGK